MILRRIGDFCPLTESYPRRIGDLCPPERGYPQPWRVIHAESPTFDHSLRVIHAESPTFASPKSYPRRIGDLRCAESTTFFPPKRVIHAESTTFLGVIHAESTTHTYIRVYTKKASYIRATVTDSAQGKKARAVERERFTGPHPPMNSRANATQAETFSKLNSQCPSLT